MSAFNSDFSVSVASTFKDVLSGNYRSYKGSDNQYGYATIDLSSSMDVRAFQFALATTTLTMRLVISDTLKQEFRLKMQPLEFVSTSHLTPEVMMQQPACCDWSDIWTPKDNEYYEPTAECLAVVMLKSIFDVRRTEKPGLLLDFIERTLEVARNDSTLLRDAMREANNATVVCQTR